MMLDCAASLVSQELLSKCAHKVSPAAQWRWRRSSANRATRRSKRLCPGLAPTYKPSSKRGTTTLTVSKHARTNTQIHFPDNIVPLSPLLLLRCSVFDGRSHLPVLCSKQRQSVCVCWSLHLSPCISFPSRITVLPTQLSPPEQASRFSREACMLPVGTTHIFRFCLPCTSWSSMCVRTCVHACKYWYQVTACWRLECMGTCSSADSQRKQGSFQYPRPPNRTPAAALKTSLIRLRRVLVES